MVCMDGWMRGGEETDGVDGCMDERGRRDAWCVWMDGWMRRGEETHGVHAWMDETGRREGWCG